MESILSKTFSVTLLVFIFLLINRQTADPQENVEGIKWPAIDDVRFGMHKISVLSTVTKLQAKRCFVNKQLTYDENFERRLFWQLYFDRLSQTNILRKFRQKWASAFIFN